MRRGKEFLLRASVLERRIDAALRKVELCKSMAEHITAAVGGEFVTYSKNPTANEDAIIRYLEAKEQVKRLQDEYDATVSEILVVLEALKKPSDELLLAEHYLKHIPISVIAERDGVTKSCVYKRCDRALDTLEMMLGFYEIPMV